MKKTFVIVFLLLILMTFFGCTTTSSTKGKYAITIDPSVKNPFAQSIWFGYISYFKRDMDVFYKNNPEGIYSKPYNIEVDARNSMIEMYLRIRKEREFQDVYIEDLIKIRNSNMLNEYVFFSFNTGNWNNDENYQEDKYIKWMKNNLPNHIPLTLAKIEKVE